MTTPDESVLGEVQGLVERPVQNAPTRIELIGQTLEKVKQLQELRQKQTETMDELRFVLEFEREMLKRGLDHKKRWALVPRGHLVSSMVPRRLVEHTKWADARPEDIVGVQDELAQHYFELPIRRHVKMRPYQSMGLGSVVEPKGTIHGFGARPRKEEDL